MGQIHDKGNFHKFAGLNLNGPKTDAHVGPHDQRNRQQKNQRFSAHPKIAVYGADWFKSVGTDSSSGTKLLSISGDCTRPGVYEVPFGISLAEVLKMVGAEDARTAADRARQPAQLGQPVARRLPPP